MTDEIKNDVRIEKKPLFKRVVDFLFSDKIDSIGYYIGSQIVKPAILDLLYQSIVGAAGMAIYNTKQVGQGPATDNPLARRYAGTQKNYTPYNQPFNVVGYQQNGEYFAPGSMVNSGYMSLKPTDISFGTKDLALYRLQQCKDAIARYNRLTVKEFFNICEVTPPLGNWAIETSGWYNLDNVTDKDVVPTTSGRWIINFPPTVTLR